MFTWRQNRFPPGGRQHVSQSGWCTSQVAVSAATQYIHKTAYTLKDGIFLPTLPLRRVVYLNVAAWEQW